MTTDTRAFSSVTTVTSNRKKSNLLGRVFLYTFLIIFTLSYMPPIFAALVTSVRTQDDISLNGFLSAPREIVLENYDQA